MSKYHLYISFILLLSISNCYSRCLDESLKEQTSKAEVILMGKITDSNFNPGFLEGWLYKEELGHKSTPSHHFGS